MSGVQVDAEINGLFNDMKMRSTHKFVFFNIEGKKKIFLQSQEILGWILLARQSQSCKSMFLF